MDIGMMIVFWYGVLHAFGPDHLTAIANFSIGKKRKEAMAVTLFFALGHGVILFIFSKVLQHYVVSAELMAYGDLIASSLIVCMGGYILYMVYADKVHLKRHTHAGDEHIHIWLGDQHNHENNKSRFSAYTVGMLMGVGGVRNMLISLGMFDTERVDLNIIFVFVIGVSVTFGIFGIIVSFINKSMLMSQKHLRRIFMTLGTVSVLVGTNTLIG